MNKILAVADIHINDYAHRNPSNKFRLYQTRKVAENIINVAKKENCNILVLAGDIVEKSVVRPYVQAEVKLFLDTIMKYFDYGFVIWGNHDLDSKSSDQDISDACLGVMLPKNLYYSHQKITKIDNTLIGFCNWMPKFDLDWIDNKVDILFTHATICYTTDAKSIYKSQELDESKFDLAICGDIHKKGSIGKYVSIGCTQRCKMSDPEEASGVVVDCETKSWKWVDLNPNNNLLKFKDTNKIELDNVYYSENNIIYSYKNDKILLDQSGRVEINTEKNIDDLIESIIVSENKLELHNNILSKISNIDEGKVDFNFTLLKLYCENWRSIKKLELDFNKKDLILLQGSNGSGKSSLLSAIRYALCDVGDTVGLSSLKPFITFGEKECLTEITFEYQGHINKLQRGSKRYGLWIDGNELKYNDKRSFEKDVRDRFPFINYSDVFFFDSDRPSFLKTTSSERITEITSKFLNLDKIDTYNKTAIDIFNKKKEEAQKLREYLNTEYRLLDHLKEELTSIECPAYSINELLEKRNSLKELQLKRSKWNSYNENRIRLETQIASTEDQLSEQISNRSKLGDISDLNKEFEILSLEFSKKQEELANLKNIRSLFEVEKSKLSFIESEGCKCSSEVKKIVVGGICPVCNKEITTITPELENKRNELNNRLVELRNDYQKVKFNVDKLSNDISNTGARYQELSSSIKDINLKLSKLSSEITKIKFMEDSISRSTRQLSEFKESLSNLVKIDEVDLPSNLIDQVSYVERSIQAWESINNSEQKIQEKTNELLPLQDKSEILSNELSELDSYIELTGPTGKIFEGIFKDLSKQFSSNLISYNVIRKGTGKRERLSLVPYYNNSGNLVSIDLCSSGQRTLLDMDYLSKLFNRLGLLILDEYFKNLDNDRLEEVLEIIKTMNINCILITSHVESIPAFYNRNIITELNSSGETVVNIR